jgi:hypothetical protein
VFGRSFTWLSRDGSAILDSNSFMEVAANSRKVACQLGGTTIHDSLETENLRTAKWTFPISSSWQPQEYRAISLCAYNLCVGCNVSLFSGWEPEEFCLRLLRRRHGYKHFGVNVDDGRISGYLSTDAEAELSQQWDEITALLPNLPLVDFRGRLAKVKESDWYMNEVKERTETTSVAPIARYGEDDGLQIFLAFSAICLKLAKLTSNEQTWNTMLQASLSVLLPVVSTLVWFQILV